MAAVAGVTAGDDAAEEEDEAVGGGTTEVLEDIDAFPLTWPVAGTDPKDFTASDLIAGVAAGDEDIGAETSSIDPKVTAEPRKHF